MRFPPLHFASAVCVLSLAPTAEAAVSLVNGSFEDPVTSDGPPFVGYWEAFDGGPGSSSWNSAEMPRTGALSLRLEIINTNNTFAGAFQDVTGVLAGTDYVFSGWHASTSNPLDVTVDVGIEWRDSVVDVEIARTPNLHPVPIDMYSSFDLSATAPAGADTARLIYAIQTFGGEPTNTGTVFLDDVAFGPKVAKTVAIASIRRTGADQFIVVWSTVVGTVYRVQRSTDLTEGSWIDVGGDIVAEDDSVAKEVNADPVRIPRRFWRVLEVE